MKIRTATSVDCTGLTETSKRSFDADIAVGAPELGGPPGYDSVEWQRRMLDEARVFTITTDEGVVIGGAVAFPTSPTELYLRRIWLDPEHQNRGLGREAMARLEKLFPQVRRWTLGTPTWNTRNQHLYQRCGYEIIGPEGEDGVVFEKIIDPSGGQAQATHG